MNARRGAHADRVGTRSRPINATAAYDQSAVVDAHSYAAAMGEVGNRDAAAEGTRAMSCGQRMRIEDAGRRPWWPFPTPYWLAVQVSAKAAFIQYSDKAAQSVARNVIINAVTLSGRAHRLILAKGRSDPLRHPMRTWRAPRDKGTTGTISDIVAEVESYELIAARGSRFCFGWIAHLQASLRACHQCATSSRARMHNQKTPLPDCLQGRDMAKGVCTTVVRQR